MPILAPAVNPDRSAAARIRSLPETLVAARTAQGISAKRQAELIGIGTDTLARVEAGANSTRETILSCLDWLAS